MNDRTIARAARLEEMLPKIMRACLNTKGDPFGDLSVSQLRIARMLFAESRTPTALSEELGMSVSAVTQMVNRMVEAGLVQRMDDSEDRRVKNLVLTDHGRELMQVRRDRRVLRTAELLESLPLQRQEELMENFEELVRIAEVLEERRRGEGMAS